MIRVRTKVVHQPVLKVSNSLIVRLSRLAQPLQCPGHFPPDPHESHLKRLRAASAASYTPFSEAI